VVWETRASNGESGGHSRVAAGELRDRRSSYFALDPRADADPASRERFDSSRRGGRYLAQHIPGAKYVEIPGTDHMLQAHDPDVIDVLLDEVEEFITGVRRRPEPDRVLFGDQGLHSLVSPANGACSSSSKAGAAIAPRKKGIARINARSLRKVRSRTR